MTIFSLEALRLKVDVGLKQRHKIYFFGLLLLQEKCMSFFLEHEFECHITLKISAINSTYIESQQLIVFNI